MTFSITARDATGFGIAISSSSPAVAARCVHLRPGVGAVASQNVTDPGLGLAVLNRLEADVSAPHALAVALAGTRFGAWRQVAVVGRRGDPAIHTGAKGLGITGAALGTDAVAAGNLLASADVPTAMLRAFDNAKGVLAERLLAGLSAGLAAGGEAGPVYSAGVAVVRDVAWPIVDLRVDWSNDPVGDLRDLWKRYEPQVEDYLNRARDPQSAPSFGVPGDP
jgi:uncharacterized Ntn-hydrolase superfamily protein